MSTPAEIKAAVQDVVDSITQLKRAQAIYEAAGTALYAARDAQISAAQAVDTSKQALMDLFDS